MSQTPRVHKTLSNEQFTIAILTPAEFWDYKTLRNV